MNIISIPLMFLNMFGGIVSGVWLLLLGSWKLVLFSILITFISPSILSFFMLMPGLLILPAMAIQNNKHLTWLSYVLAFISMFLNTLIMCIWGILVLGYFAGNADVKTFIPLYLLSYVVATGPFAYMASKEPPASAGHIYNFWFQAAYLLLIIILMFIEIPIFYALIILLLVMIAPIIMNFYMYRCEQKLS